MKLQTFVKVEPSRFPIDHRSKILMLGSCFATNMAAKFEYFKYDVTTNPHGIIFNPVSLENLIRNSLAQKNLSKDLIVETLNGFKSFECHSDIKGNDLNEISENISNANQRLKSLVETASHIFVTLGTAWVYRQLATNKIVANCHKVKSSQFKKELISVTEIEKSIEGIIQIISNKNLSAKIIFTVSPVRHIKDGIIENQRGKSNLFAALHNVLDRYSEITSYFPAYEIMMDELRDYRFYKDDMLHPTDLAVNYIWNIFAKAYFSEQTSLQNTETDKLQKALLHRPRT